MENKIQKCPITQSVSPSVLQSASELKETVKSSKIDDKNKQTDKKDGFNISNDQNAANKIEIKRTSPIKQEKREEEKSNLKSLNNNKENNKIDSNDIISNNNNTTNIIINNNNDNNINNNRNNSVKDSKSTNIGKEIEKANEPKISKLKRSEEFLNAKDVEPELIEIINFNKGNNHIEISKSNRFQSLSAHEAISQNNNANREKEMEESSEERLRILANVRKNSKMLNINNNFQRAASPFSEMSPSKGKKKKGIKLRFLLDESTTTDMLYQKTHTVKLFLMFFDKMREIKFWLIFELNSLFLSIRKLLATTSAA
jgi:hypothetical protein